MQAAMDYLQRHLVFTSMCMLHHAYCHCPDLKATKHFGLRYSCKAIRGDKFTSIWCGEKVLPASKPLALPGRFMERDMRCRITACLRSAWLIFSTPRRAALIAAYVWLRHMHAYVHKDKWLHVHAIVRCVDKPLLLQPTYVYSRVGHTCMRMRNLYIYICFYTYMRSLHLSSDVRIFIQNKRQKHFKGACMSACLHTHCKCQCTL
jgi:hypothetical protein